MIQTFRRRHAASTLDKLQRASSFFANWSATKPQLCYAEFRATFLEMGSEPERVFPRNDANAAAMAILLSNGWVEEVFRFVTKDETDWSAQNRVSVGFRLTDKGLTRLALGTGRALRYAA
jgi:hypothetical protein